MEVSPNPVKDAALESSSSDKEATPLAHHRSFTVDNADLLDNRRGSLEHADVEDDLHSLPSLGHLGDQTAGLSSSVGTDPDALADAGFPSYILDPLSNPCIGDDTPAAEALRANAAVRVAKLGKLARKVHVQAVRRLVKKATLRAKSGNVRGKPPRIPPPGARTPSDVATGPVSDMFVLHEEDEDEAGEQQMDSSIESSEQDGEINHDQQVEAMTAQMSEGARLGTLEEDMPQEEVGRQDDFVEKEADWQTHFRQGEDKIPAEVITATMETGEKVLGNVDPHDILQSHRWRRRKRRGAKDDRKSYVKGKVINGEHELYTLSIAVMLGVRTSIGTTNGKMGASHGKHWHWLSSDDFMASEKYEFSPKGGPRTPAHQLSHTFKFKDYSPMAFAYLRRMFGVNEFDFLLSVCGNANFIEFISNAKSGQFFFYSSDGKYMIKTMTNVESKFLRRILPHYFRHCAKNPNTLLTKFLGMYRVKMYHLRRNVKFVIMNSVYHTDRHLHSFYDLKGSVLGRAAKPIHDVKKDNDLRRGMPGSAIALPPNVRERLREQIVADCEFMEKMDIMDYSMLIGVHHMPLAQERSHMSDSLRISSKRQAGSFTLGDLMKKKCHNAVSSVDQNSTTFEGDILSPQSLRPSSKGARASDGPSKASQSVSSAGTPTRSATEKSKDSARQRKQQEEEQLSSLQAYEQGYEDDEDGSYLEGSDEYKSHSARVSANGSAAKLGDSASKVADIEYKKAQTVEQIYWPFHRYYDIYGYRRMAPTPCTACHKVDCSCGRDEDLLAGLKIPPFEPPLSTRKDGGLMMDTTGIDMPMKVTVHGQEQLCEGKIFYMGIIDILQQYNIRKRFEARYRRLQSNGWQDASCVNPHIYADRFVRFFDEYSQRGDTAASRAADEGGEQIVDVRSRDSVKIVGSHSSDEIEVSHLKKE